MLPRLLALVLMVSACHSAAAHSYQIIWDFDYSVGAEYDPRPWQEHERLLYNSTTGDLRYQSDSPSGWNPPDVLSLSGVLLEDRAINDVPMHMPVGYPPELLALFEDWRPRWTRDEEVLGVVAAGSDAIRINFDRLKFWPYEIDDPRMLHLYGADEGPTEFSYGRLLPPGLSREDLVEDLFTTHPVEFLVVPEGTALAMACTAFGVGRMRPRRR